MGSSCPPAPGRHDVVSAGRTASKQRKKNILPKSECRVPLRPTASPSRMRPQLWEGLVKALAVMSPGRGRGPRAPSPYSFSRVHLIIVSGER